MNKMNECNLFLYKINEEIAAFQSKYLQEVLAQAESAQFIPKQTDSFRPFILTLIELTGNVILRSNIT